MHPTTTKKTTNMSLTAEVDYRHANIVANTNGKCIATMKDIIFDRLFVEKLRGSGVFLHWSGAPEVGVYHICRDNRRLIKLFEYGGDFDYSILKKFKWHEELYVTESVPTAVEVGCLLVLDVGRYGRTVLDLHANYRDNELLRAVQVKVDCKTTEAQIDIRTAEEMSYSYERLKMKGLKREEARRQSELDDKERERRYELFWLMMRKAPHASIFEIPC
jgi:hypothetical protein